MVFPEEYESFRKVLFFFYAGAASYAIYIFISLILDHIDDFHNYWHCVSYKKLHFLNFYFQALVFTYFIMIFHWYFVIR